MAPTVAPLRNPYAPVPERRSVVAPMPATQTRVMATQRANTPTTYGPPDAPLPSATVAPIAYAMGQYQETGDPFTAAAQGWINASNVREQDAIEKGKRSQVAEAIKGHPDLARFVENGVMEPADAIRIAGDRDKVAADTGANEARKAKILEYLGKSDPDLAEAFAAGAIDEDGIAREIGKRNDAPTDNAREQQIARLMETGLDRNTAIGIVDGRLKDTVNPATGERSIIDMGDRSITPLRQPTYEPPAEVTEQPQPQTGKTLWEMAPEATGVGSALANVSSNTLGQIPGAIGEAMTFEGPVAAQQEFELFKRDLIQSLSLNPKFPVAEMERIEGLIPSGAAVAAGTLTTSMKALDRELARIEKLLEASLSDPRTPLEQKQADTVTLRGVKGARTRMGVPQEDDAGDDLTELSDEELLRMLGQ